MNTSIRAKRSKEEFILLALCVTGFAGIAPFAVLRLVNGDLWLAAIDFALVVGVLLIGLYVWSTRRVRVPGIVLTAFYLFGMVTAVYLSQGKLVNWAFPTMLAAYFLVRPREAVMMNAAVSLLLLVPLVKNLPSLEISSILVTLILTNAFAFIFARKMQVQHAELEKLATRDALTGAGNRRLFDEKVLDCLAHHERFQVPAALILLDIDHFKQINDEYGHGAGDEVLIKLIQLLRHRLRAVDGLYRIGGEEFAVVVQPADIDRMVDLAEALRRLVENSELIADRTVTISVGLATCSEGDTGKSWARRADQALYKAKNGGRNRTCLEPVQGKIF